MFILWVIGYRVFIVNLSVSWCPYGTPLKIVLKGSLNLDILGECSRFTVIECSSERLTVEVSFDGWMLDV